MSSRTGGDPEPAVSRSRAELIRRIERCSVQTAFGAMRRGLSGRFGLIKERLTLIVVAQQRGEPALSQQPMITAVLAPLAIDQRRRSMLSLDRGLEPHRRPVAAFDASPRPVLGPLCRRSRRRREPSTELRPDAVIPFAAQLVTAMPVVIPFVRGKSPRDNLLGWLIC